MLLGISSALPEIQQTPRSCRIPHGTDRPRRARACPSFPSLAFGARGGLVLPSVFRSRSKQRRRAGGVCFEGVGEACQPDPARRQSMHRQRRRRALARRRSRASSSASATAAAADATPSPAAARGLGRPALPKAKAARAAAQAAYARAQCCSSCQHTVSALLCTRSRSIPPSLGRAQRGGPASEPRTRPGPSPLISAPSCPPAPRHSAAGSQP